MRYIILSIIILILSFILSCGSVETEYDSRYIPVDVKKQVYRRDKGRCVCCGVTNNLEYDHVFPYSKGGASDKVSNIQLLCRRCNASKSDGIKCKIHNKMLDHVRP